MKELELTPLIRRAAQVLETPFLVLDNAYVRENYLRLKNSINNVEIFFMQLKLIHTLVFLKL